MTLGKQHRHCPNCGKALYDNALTMDHVKSLMCSRDCREEWEMKYARMILHKDAPPETEIIQQQLHLPYRLPTYCIDCGAYLMGGATQHEPGCFVLKLIEEAQNAVPSPGDEVKL